MAGRWVFSLSRRLVFLELPPASSAGDLLPASCDTSCGKLQVQFSFIEDFIWVVPAWSRCWRININQNPHKTQIGCLIRIHVWPGGVCRPDLLRNIAAALSSASQKWMVLEIQDDPAMIPDHYIIYILKWELSSQIKPSAHQRCQSFGVAAVCTFTSLAGQ